MSNKAASNVIPMREFERMSSDPQAAQFDRLLKECQTLAWDRLARGISTMLTKGEESLWAMADQCMDREQRDVYVGAKDKLVAERKNIGDQFHKNYLAEFERRAKRETKREEFSQYDLSSLELGLVNDEDLEETLKINDMSAKLRRYCEEELNALDQRIGVLIGDANLQGDGNPFSPQTICTAWKLTCRGIEPSMKHRMLFHKLFDDHILDEVRSIYKDINELLIQRSILPKIRFGIRRAAGGIGRRPGAAPAQGATDAAAAPSAQAAMAAGMNIPMGSPGAESFDAGSYGAEGEGDLFGMLQSLLARGAHMPAAGHAQAGMPAGMMPAAYPGMPGGVPFGGGVPGGVPLGAGVHSGVPTGVHIGDGVPSVPLSAGVPGGIPGIPVGAAVPSGMPLGAGVPMVQIPGFPPILSAGMEAGGGQPVMPGTAGANGLVQASGLPAINDGAVLPPRFLQGADLIGSLTRLQHGDAAALPASMSAIDLVALASGRTNVARELKSSGLGEHVDQTDGVTIDIVAMLFDQIFGDPRVPEALKALIGRLQIPVVKVAVLDKKFFSKKSHPARRMLDTLGEFALGLDETFDQSSPIYKSIEGIIARLLEDFVDNVDVFEQLHTELLAVIRDENKRAELATKEMARKIAYKERLEVGKAMAQLEIKNRAQTNQMPQLIQRFLAEDWLKLLLLTYARHGQDSDAWKSALETMDHLIWSVTSKASIEERRRLAHLLPGLLKRLQTGLQSIGSAEETRKQFFSRLMRMHTKAMSGNTARREAPKPEAPKPQPVSATTPAATHEVPTLSEEVTPTAPAVTSVMTPNNMPPMPDLAAPSLPVLDFGLEAIPVAAPAQPVSSEHVVAAPAIPAMTSASTAPTAAEIDEDAQPAESLDFTNVTIKNPFGEGDIQVEEISLSDLPGLNAAGSDGDTGPDDQYSRAVKNLKTGDWLEFRDGAQQLQARLSYISPLKGTYLFVNRRGDSVGEYSLVQLAQQLRSTHAVLIEDVPLIDRAMSSLVGALKKNTR